MTKNERRLVTIVARFLNRVDEIERARSAAFDDLRAFGAPSECGAIINRGCDRKIGAEAERLGFNVETLYALAAQYRVKNDGPMAHGFAPEYFAGPFAEQQVGGRR
jgi:hypothetical protein